MMSEAETSNVYIRDEDPPNAFHKPPTPEQHSPTVQAQPSTANENSGSEARTVTCSNPEMTQILQRVDSLKNKLVTTFKTSKQSVLEHLGKVDKTVDADMDNRINNLNDLHKRYNDVLSAATAYSGHFNAWTESTKSLSEGFYQLSLRESDLKEPLTDKNETLRQFGQHADEFSKKLAHIVNSLRTLCSKTFTDTLATIQVYENARLEYDAHRHELTLLQQTPNTAAKHVDDLQAKCESLKQRYLQLKDDVQVKLALLDENRLKVMKAQLDQFEKGLQQYFTESLKTLTNSLPAKTEEDTDSQFVRGARDSGSFLEQ